jgi:hypothetical protein
LLSLTSRLRLKTAAYRFLTREFHRWTVHPRQTVAADRPITAGPRFDNAAAALLATAPLGEYLLTRKSGQQLLWRISEGEPPDGALEPAESWTLTY